MEYLQILVDKQLDNQLKCYNRECTIAIETHYFDAVRRCVITQ